SLLDRDGRNIFAGADETGSELLRHAIGGLQALMPESMALFAPSINSYRRFEPDMFAPVNRRWGVNNRSAGSFRVGSAASIPARRGAATSRASRTWRCPSRWTTHWRG